MQSPSDFEGKRCTHQTVPGQIRSYDDSKSLPILSNKGIKPFADLFDGSRFDGLRLGR
jgi:hypothetical protein